MLQPVGPLPPSVYWRRRGVAAAAVVLVLALLVWAIAALASADGSVDEIPVAAPAPAQETPSPIASQGALAAPPGGAAGLPGVDGTVLGPTAPQPGAPTSRGPLRAAPTPDMPLRALPNAPDPARSSAPELTPAPRGSDPRGSAPQGSTPRGAVPEGAAPQGRTAPRPEACPDSALRVTARTDQPRYRSGARPELVLVVGNVGSVPCFRDLGPARQAMAVVRTPGDGLWGSDDCAPGGEPDVRTLRPGQELRFTVRWAGRTSTPGCPSNRSTVPPGTYQLITRLDEIVSEPTRFTLT